jgi:hypothetical protein
VERQRVNSRKPLENQRFLEAGVPYEIRTRVAAVSGGCRLRSSRCAHCCRTQLEGDCDPPRIELNDNCLALRCRQSTAFEATPALGSAHESLSDAPNSAVNRTIFMHISVT